MSGPRADRASSLTFSDIPVYHLSVQQILSEFNIDIKHGLNDEEVIRNRQEYGSNVIPEGKGRPWWKILLHQSLNAINLILLIVVIVCAVNKEFIDMCVVIAIILLNIVIGFVSEMKSESSLSALANLTKGNATVLRNGSTEVIGIDEVVVGDILILKAGDAVPADARVILSNNLELDEALLTGEAHSIFKGVEALPLPQQIAGLDIRVSIADRNNMVFRQTNVIGGTGSAIVAQVGIGTKIGALSDRLQSGQQRGTTRFQKNLNILMYVLFAVALFLAFLIFCIVKFKVNQEVIVYAASTAIALLPEALIMVTTIALALGMVRLAKKKAVVRKMNALTNLSSISVAISDKTGTLTLGQMVLKRFWVYNAPNLIYHVTGGAMDCSGGFGIEYDASDPNSQLAETYRQTRLARAETRRNTRTMSLYGGSLHQSDPTSRIRQPSYAHNVMKVITGTPESEISAVQKVAEQLALVCALCNDTVLQIDEENDKLVGSGFNPTEGACTVFTYKLGLPPSYFEDEYGWITAGTHAFDSKLKRKSTGIFRYKTDEQGNVLPDAKKESLILVKGATEAILPLCIGNLNIDDIMQRSNHLASQGLRVLACAIGNHLEIDDVDGKRLNEYDRTLVEKDLTFIGLVAIQDPPRPESFIAVDKCKTAGITFVVASGDSPLTTTSVARTLGILGPDDGDDRVMTGPVIDAMTDEQLDELPNLPLVIGRCSPESKVKMVEAYRRRGKVISMSGDGVNDAPSLSCSDVGFCMGIAGTEITKQASDVVILDDNIATIINAIEEGRHITASIKKFLTLLLISNIAEVIVLLVGLVFRDNNNEVVFPLMALEILVINIVTSSPPAIALTMDDPDPDLMQQEPSPPGGGFFTKEVTMDLTVYGIIVAALCFVAYVLTIFTFGNGDFGSHCNTKAGIDSCKLVWRARTTTFATLYELLLVQAYACRHERRSIFAQSLINNPVLVASFILGTLFIFPCIYIPWIAKNLFKHGPISWEWAIVAVALVIHLGCVELYKFIKRTLWGEKPNVFTRARYTSTTPTKKGYHTTEDGGVIELR